MIRPTVSSTYFEERKGVYRVAELFTLMSLIFRETPNADVGIDGQVELIDGNNQATGATIAVQIKSGTSYLKDGGDSWKYYPAEKHRIYWEAYPLPVILFEIGSVGSPYEITEASIGLAYRPLLIFRSQANLAVARKVEEYFLDSTKRNEGE